MLKAIFSLVIGGYIFVFVVRLLSGLAWTKAPRKDESIPNIPGQLGKSIKHRGGWLLHRPGAVASFFRKRGSKSAAFGKWQERGINLVFWTIVVLALLGYWGVI